MSSNPMGTCPLGGLWYTCTAQSPTFLGCCTSNPCNGVGCPASDFRAAGMGTASGPDPGISNDGSYWPNVQCSIGQWWTCAAQTPSFQGCCETNPCEGSGSAGGCPAGKLHPAAFKSVPVDSTTVPNSTPATAKTTPATTPTTLSTAPKSASPATNNPSPTQVTQSLITTTLANGVPSTATIIIVQTAAAAGNGTAAALPSPSSPNIGAIAGGAAGGGVLFLILAFVIWRIYKNRKQRAAQNDATLQSAFEASRGPPGGPTKGIASNVDITPISAQANCYEAYYPGQPIFGVPPPIKATHSPQPSISSPGPPPYQSPTTNAHEIDSRDIHEIASTSPHLHSSETIVSEMPTPEMQQGRWSGGNGRTGLGLGVSSPQTVVSEVDGEGVNRRSGRSAANSKNPVRGSYTAWENYS